MDVPREARTSQNQFCINQGSVCAGEREGLLTMMNMACAWEVWIGDVYGAAAY